MQTKIKGITSAGLEVDLKATEGGVLITTSQERRWTTKGYGWQTMTTAAVASLIVRPSTLSLLTLYNNTGSKSLVIERAFAHALVSIANCQFGIWLCSHPTGMAVPTGNNIAIRNSNSGLAAGAEVVADTDEAVIDNGWYPWGVSRTQVVATVPGGLAEAQIGGRIIVPPTAGLSIQVVANTAVVTTCVGFHYYLVPTDELDVN